MHLVSGLGGGACKYGGSFLTKRRGKRAVQVGGEYFSQLQPSTAACGFGKRGSMEQGR